MATVIEFTPQDRSRSVALPAGHSADVLPIRFDRGDEDPATSPDRKKAHPKKR